MHMYNYLYTSVEIWANAQQMLLKLSCEQLIIGKMTLWESRLNEPSLPRCLSHRSMRRREGWSSARNVNNRCQIVCSCEIRGKGRPVPGHRERNASPFGYYLTSCGVTVRVRGVRGASSIPRSAFYLLRNVLLRSPRSAETCAICATLCRDVSHPH